MKISICGSMTFADDMLAAQQQLQDLGFETEIPDLSEKQDWSGWSEEKRYKNKERLIRQHLAKIRSSDAILVFNKPKNNIPGYVGGNTLMEMAFAFAQGIKIFMLYDAKDMSYADEIYGMQPIVLEGRIPTVLDYF